jgi:hypothetical protein
MRKISTSFIPEVILALSFLPLLHSQTSANAPAEINASAANPAPAGQAPDEVTKKITELFHAGKYAEAQQLTTGMLLAYPNDQRLIKAKAFLDKVLAPGASATATPGSAQPASNSPSAPPRANTTPGQLAGMDKVDYSALLILAKQAQQTTDLDEQKKLLQQFMDQSSPFLQKHPDKMLLWQFRVVSALSLDDLMAGYEAGQALLAAGAADSDDPNLQELLGQLKNKGWLDKRKVQAFLESIEAARLKAEHDKYTFPVERPLGSFRWSPNGYGHLTINENGLVYDGSDGHVQLSKSEVRRIDIYLGLISVVPKDGKTLSLLPATEDAVTQKRQVQDLNLPATGLENAVVDRWKFVAESKGFGAVRHRSLHSGGQ